MLWWLLSSNSTPPWWFISNTLQFTAWPISFCQNTVKPKHLIAVEDWKLVTTSWTRSGQYFNNSVTSCTLYKRSLIPQLPAIRTVTLCTETCWGLVTTRSRFSPGSKSDVALHWELLRLKTRGHFPKVSKFLRNIHSSWLRLRFALLFFSFSIELRRTAEVKPLSSFFCLQLPYDDGITNEKRLMYTAFTAWAELGQQLLPLEFEKPFTYLLQPGRNRQPWSRAF